MTTDAVPLPPARPRLARFLEDLRLAMIMCVVAAIVITLVVGKPETLYEQIVFSLCIGTLAFGIVDGARLLFWDRPLITLRQWLPFVGVMLLAAPVAHFTGMHIGFAIMGYEPPTLAEYPNAGRVSMIGLTFMVIASVTMLVRHRERLRRIRQEHADARLRAEMIERQALQAQLRLLQAQIEPHMLFNTLANLQGLIALDPERAGRMLDQLIQYLRATLGATRSERTTLGQEFAAMEAYLGLMQVRMGERLSYRLELPEALRKAGMPPMLLQPLVENAIIHGLEPKIEGGEVRIAAEARDGLLEICVRDTGLGLREAPASRGGGVGVSTTRERLRAIYGEAAGVVLAPGQPSGAIVRLTLPLETTA
jgi:hypothetical protein